MSRPRQHPAILLAILATVGAGSAVGGERLPDPTRPPGLGAPSRTIAKVPTYTVSSVVIGAQRRLAVVNGETVAEGDRVDGARVLAVLAAGVRLERNGREFTVDLLPRDFKKRADNDNKTKR